MTIPRSETVQPALDDSRFEAVYEEHFDFLVAVARRKFRVPETEAETLAHEVFLTYLRKADTIRDLRAWMVGAICHASRYYWRSNGRAMPMAEMAMDVEPADPASIRILDSLPDQLAAREALACLAPRWQEVLRLRYFEGCSVSEVAERLGLKARYTQKLIAKCLRRAEQRYAAKGKGKR